MDAETESSYSEARFGRATAPGSQPAVLVIDLCRAYFDVESPLHLGRPVVAESTARVVDAGRAAGVPVVWTRVEFQPDGSDGGVWYQKLEVLRSFDKGNPLADWLPGLVPAPDEIVVTKQHASGFFGTDLASQLHRLGIDSLLICGVSTSGCVRATATDASASGFAPFIVRQAVGDRTDAVHEANLFDLHAKYADVIDEATALEHLDLGAGRYV